ncbi:MAG TPA: exodeoxyribonuclease III [Candidatus Sulfotelmatobacter sp.]|nr:exodeoxyribonuclease III [Candidatus Sulfotelmatobacter sp.]
MRIATWNVNSVRLRLEQLKAVDEHLRPDVLCLQETKVVDELFPHDAFKALGFEHIAVKGMKSYNGVAIASKLPLENIQAPQWCGKDDCRHLAATIQGIEVHNLYIPAGGDIPDPEQNEKFAHKLGFIDALTTWFAETGGNRPMVALGDFNIAPLETDVWSHKQLLKVVSHTPIEVERLAGLQASLRWIDGVRRFIPPSEHLYSWWSYRSPDWAAGNKGRRLDHIWVTPPLESRLGKAMVMKETRSWAPPSDHVPVLLELA